MTFFNGFFLGLFSATFFYDFFYDFFLRLFPTTFFYDFFPTTLFSTAFFYELYFQEVVGLKACEFLFSGSRRFFTTCVPDTPYLLMLTEVEGKDKWCR